MYPHLALPPPHATTVVLHLPTPTSHVVRQPWTPSCCDLSTASHLRNLIELLSQPSHHLRNPHTDTPIILVTFRNPHTLSHRPLCHDMHITPVTETSPEQQAFLAIVARGSPRLPHTCNCHWNPYWTPFSCCHCESLDPRDDWDRPNVMWASLYASNIVVAPDDIEVASGRLSGCHRTAVTPTSLFT